MALNQQLLEEGSSDDYGSEPNTSSTDEHAAISDLHRGAGEMMVIRALQSFIRPIFVPIFRPLIRQIVAEQIGLANQELLAIIKENMANKAITSVQKNLKLQFRNKVSEPVLTGKPLLGLNTKTIEIVLVNSLNDQIVNTGPESMAKLEIVGFRVGDDENSDYSWSFEDFQKMIFSEKKGKRTLQGDTCLRLKKGVCIIGKISFTHSSENTKKGWYRLGAGIVDAAFMNRVEVATTEAFLVKDGRSIYSEKHLIPSLLDKVCHLQQIRYKGTRYRRLEDAGVITVKDLLILFYTDRERLEHILELKVSSKIWGDIVKNAQASNGMFLYLDPHDQQKTGVVLNVKLQLMALIGEANQYIPVNQLSDKQKVDNQNLVKLASENLDTIHSFEDETSLIEYLQSSTQSLENFKITDEPPTPSKQVTYAPPGLTQAPNNGHNSNLHTDQTTNRAPIVTVQSERGKEIADPLDDELIYSRNFYQEGCNVFNFGNATEAGTSSQAVECLVDNTYGFMNTFDIFNTPPEELDNFISTLLEIPNNEWHSTSANCDTTDVASVCSIAQTRWTKVIKLLRRNSVRERIRVSEGIQANKRQRCC